MDVNKLKKYSVKSEDEFKEKFGFLLMASSRKELYELIDLGLSLNDPIINKKIYNNIPFLLHKTKIGNLGLLLEVLAKNPTCYNYLIANFSEIKPFLAPNNIEKVIDVFLKHNNNSKIVADNFETLLENGKTQKQASAIISKVSHIPSCEAKIKLYNSICENLENDFAFLCSLNPGTMLKLVASGELENLKDIFRTYSDGNLQSVRYLASGFTSSVFSVNDKVIKVGKQRIKFNAQFSPYLLQPYLRKEIHDLNDEVIATIEVQDKCSDLVDMDEIKNFCFKLLKDKDKYIWLDGGFSDTVLKASTIDPSLIDFSPNAENFLKLIKPNIAHCAPEETGYVYNSDFTSEPKGLPGDIIIADTDFVFSPEEYRERLDSYKTPPHSKKFSLVLPTYNMEEYIGNCLNSILNQTINDYEVIIINDGSTDRSEEIAQSYAAMDSRFKVSSYENAGLSTARNRGIDLATGEYILLIDPDDTINPELLEKLSSYDQEIVRFGALVVNDNPQKDDYRFNRQFYPEILSGIESLARWNDDKRYATAWLYSVKKEVYDRSNFRFPLVKLYEDLASIPNLIANANSVALLDYIGYNYIQNDRSLTNIISPNKPIKNLRGFIEGYDFINDYMKKYFELHPENKEQYETQILDGFFTRLENKFRHTNSYKKDSLSLDLLSRNRTFPIDHQLQDYFHQPLGQSHDDLVGYTPNNGDFRIISYDDTSFYKCGSYTYKTDENFETIDIYRVSKKGQYNYTDDFLCLSKIDYDRLISDPNYKEMVFKYLLSYTNIFLGNSLNGNYIGEICDHDGSLGIKFDSQTTKFAKNLRENCKMQLPLKSSAHKPSDDTDMLL